MAGELTQRERRAELLDRFEHTTEWPLLFLALLMAPLLVIQFALNPSDATDTAIETLLWFIWAIFAVELGIRTFLAERKIPYLINHWYDVLIVAIPFLRPLRIARSARAMRLLRLSRVAPFLARAAVGTQHLLRRHGLQWVILTSIVIVIGGAAVVLAFEQDSTSGIDDYGTALWWAITTVTTVGYGDTAPVTAEGRGIAVLLMLVGIAFFSWVTANIAAFLVEFGGGEANGVSTHDLMAKLEDLEAEVKALRAERVRGHIVDDSD